MSVKFFGFGSIRESRIGNGESLEQEQRRLSDSRFPSPDSQLVGAHNRNRTCDLFLTKEVLYRLSYVSMELSMRKIGHPAATFAKTVAAKPRHVFRYLAQSNGAGDGNRTRTISLEG